MSWLMHWFSDGSHSHCLSIWLLVIQEKANQIKGSLTDQAAIIRNLEMKVREREDQLRERNDTVDRLEHKLMERDQRLQAKEEKIQLLATVEEEVRIHKHMG